MHDLGTLGGVNSQGYAINASGQVAGGSNSPSGYHAFLYDGTMHDLGTLGGSGSVGYAINASGQVTGLSNLANPNVEHAFLYDQMHGMVDLNSLIDPASGWELLVGLGINDAGQITGWGQFNGAGNNRAFLLTPIANNVPEPSSVSLIACGMASLIAVAIRRRAIRASCS